MTRRCGKVALVTLFVLGLTATMCSAAGILAVGGTKVLSATQMEVTVTYQFAASQAQQANLVLRPLPLSLVAQFDIAPRSVAVQPAGSPQQKTFVLTWKGTGTLAVAEIALALDAGGGVRPFSTQRVTVNWSFPLAATPAAGETATTPPSTPTTTVTTRPLTRPGTVPALKPLVLLTGPKAMPLDTTVSASNANTVRSTLTGVRRAGGVPTGTLVQDRGLYHTLMLITPVTQPKATDQPLPLGEVITDYVPPVLGSPGTSEPTDTTKPTSGGRPSPEQLPAVANLKCQNVSTRQRGWYVVNFSYHINDATDRVPITFDCVFAPDAAPWVAMVPWVHEAPAKGVIANGAISLYIDSLDAPLSLGKAPFTLRARGKKGVVLAEVKLTPKFDWVKSYAQMSRTNLIDYWNSATSAPGVTKLDIYGAGTDSMEERAKRYSEEPPMLVFKTAQGSYGRGLFKTCVGGQGLKGLWLVDLDCYLGAPPYWLEGRQPPDLNDYANRSYRSYDLAGLLLKGMQFDLDWGGFNCTNADADIIVQTDATGTKYYLSAVNGCEIKY